VQFDNSSNFTMGLGKFFKQYGGPLLGIAAGFAFGPGAFSAKYFSIGSLVGGFLFGRAPKVAPNGLDSLNIGGSSYGTPIPILYGKVKLAGNIIDAKQENAITQVERKGGYDWFISCEVLFCEALDGPRIVDKLWGYSGDTNELMFDRDAEGDAQGYQLTLDPATGMETGYWPGSGETIPGLGIDNPFVRKLVLKRGTGSQTTVPEIAALHGGVGCPYRWQTTATFINLPIGNSAGEGWRGSMPTIKALVRDPRTGVREVIEAHLVRGGVPAEKIDSSGIPEEREFTGYIQQGKEAPRELADKAAALAFCDLIQVGGIKASDRTNPTIVELAPEELRAHRLGEEMPPVAAITIGADIDLPSKLTLRFIDPDMDYQVNSVTVLRQVVEDVNERIIEVPVVMTEAEAKVIAQTMLDEAWAARTPYKVALLPGRIAMAPGDVVNLPVNNTMRLLRITNQTIGAPGPIVCDAVSYDPDVYDQPEPTASTPRPTPTVPVYGEPVLVAFDANAARDEDVNATGGFYAGYTLDAGANAFKSCTLSTWPAAMLLGLKTITFRQPAIVGTAVNALPTFTSSGDIDRANTLIVDIHEALTLTSVDETDIYNDANKAVLKVGSADWEFINFADAEAVAGAAAGYQRWELSTLRRGQRGTEWLMGAHAIGNQFVLMNDAIERVSCAVPTIQRTVSLRRDELYPESCYIWGNALKPFSPALVNEIFPSGVTEWRDVSNNLKIAFVQRSKYTDPSLLTGHPAIDAPGDLDLFDIDIMDGATVLRTITTSTTATSDSGVTLFTATYSAAQQTADGLTPGDPVTVWIYRRSSIITRGQRVIATI